MKIEVQACRFCHVYDVPNTPEHCAKNNGKPHHWLPLGFVADTANPVEAAYAKDAKAAARAAARAERLHRIALAAGIRADAAARAAARAADAAADEVAAAYDAAAHAAAAHAADAALAADAKANAADAKAESHAVYHVIAEASRMAMQAYIDAKYDRPGKP